MNEGVYGNNYKFKALEMSIEEVNAYFPLDELSIYDIVEVINNLFGVVKDLHEENKRLQLQNNLKKEEE